MSPESVEFAALLTASGWKPSEAARRLLLGRGAVSQYLSGTSRPSPQVLELFKRILASELPEAISAVSMPRERLEDWERTLLEELRWIEPQDLERAVRIMRAFIAGLPRRKARNYPAIQAKSASLNEKFSSEKVSAAQRRIYDRDRPRGHGMDTPGSASDTP